MKTIFVLQKSLNQYFTEINLKNEVVITDNSMNAMLFDNIYTANSFKTRLKDQYLLNFNVIEL